MSWYEDDTLTALQAKEQAQKLAFAPIAFQAARSLDELGILAVLDSAADGLDTATIAERSGVSEYGVGVLLDMGLSARIVTQDSERRYRLARLGHFLLLLGSLQVRNRMTDLCKNAVKFVHGEASAEPEKIVDVLFLRPACPRLRCDRRDQLVLGLMHQMQVGLIGVEQQP